MLAKMMESVVDTRLAESENLLLEEMDRLQTNLTNRIDKIDVRLDTIQHDCFYTEKSLTFLCV